MILTAHGLKGILKGIKPNPSTIPIIPPRQFEE